MKYKFLILILILFIMSISLVSAEPPENKTTGGIADSINIENNILLENTNGEHINEGNKNIHVEHTNIENNNPLSSENTKECSSKTNHSELISQYYDGTFNDLENIIWRASDGDKIVLDRDYSYDGGDRKIISITIK